MARRLTKKTLSGTVLERLPQIETELDELAALPSAILLQRITISTRRATGYCSSEALVGLYRDALTRRDNPLVNRLIEILTRRCTKAAQTRLYARGINDPEAVKAVVDRFVDLLVEETGPGGCPKLDFYEVLFENAITALVASEARRARVMGSRFVPIGLPDGEGSEADAIDALSHEEHFPSTLTGPEQGVFTSQLIQAMTDLTDGEREVAILTVLGVQIESVDKSEPTIASQCNIEPRSVRYRQKRVAEKLAKYKE
ncbi:helix-turn-helix transcriptional regulator [Cupriavidus sp. EM10]|uniref:helix-turn-helix transcriptional regulator n=1 Tax=Cupriavidus sp. EM10 TaxID=2839983 RepID=UPI001C00261A|nr:hypothetical protein [Cupriavidus sp. EM10]QWE98149.1 hypothetical protein KLP38_28515 [Cupriavidus sp. EM10]